MNWEGGQIRRLGKGGKYVTTPLTSYLRSILEPLRGYHSEFVFTHVAARTTRPRKAGVPTLRTGNRKNKGQAYLPGRNQEERIKGRRYPLTVSGVASAWKRLRKKAGVQDFRIHDFRHDFATKLLRQTGNLKLVSKALNHAKLETTMRYAHVLDGDIADALEELHSAKRARVTKGDPAQKLYDESRNKSRSTIRDVA